MYARAHYFHNWWYGDTLDFKPGYIADNLKVCSCYMCGNPRKWYGLPTRKERIAEFSLREQIADWSK